MLSDIEKKIIRDLPDEKLMQVFLKTVTDKIKEVTNGHDHTGSVKNTASNTENTPR
jgi:hypothetical protein